MIHAFILDFQGSSYLQAVTSKWMTAQLQCDLKGHVLSSDFLRNTLHKAKPYCEAKEIQQKRVVLQLAIIFIID